jgi:hypothetical protein
VSQPAVGLAQLWIVRRHCMHQKLTKRQRVVCGIVAFCAAAVYVGAFMIYARTAWGRNEGDFQPVPSWVEHFSRDLIIYPFALVPALGSWVFILNMLFWSTVGVGTYLFIYRRARHLPTLIVIIAWLIFIVSFFLPATNVVENGWH